MTRIACAVGMMLGLGAFGCQEMKPPEPSDHEAHAGAESPYSAEAPTAGAEASGAHEPGGHVGPESEASHALGSHGHMPGGDVAMPGGATSVRNAAGGGATRARSAADRSSSARRTA